VLGGGMMYLFTLKSKKKEAAATAQNAEAMAESQELNNVEKAIAIWRKMAEDLEKELDKQRQKTVELTTQINELSKEVKRLTCINSRIMRLLDNITPDNIESTVGKMKKMIDDNRTAETGNN
jgi:septal ring factor EnvC (AmiA/AmiB activator)